ncbi:hypothetical protein PYCCODRAFT_976050 [Trametes coccinea BRFM310]|uniref:Uncharacterized protein n=1 Tax=Trametes coccinea (strain BRFM310) TaxID=1353009 RepID=A0A1Y2IBT6_TRAC3|nr:hypothetical protein PYCCODRAFT_976050 [Trametes coccinea BRFM310]
MSPADDAHRMLHVGSANAEDRSYLGRTRERRVDHPPPLALRRGQHRYRTSQIYPPLPTPSDSAISNTCLSYTMYFSRLCNYPVAIHAAYRRRRLEYLLSCPSLRAAVNPYLSAATTYGTDNHLSCARARRLPPPNSEVDSSPLYVRSFKFHSSVDPN